MSAGAELLVSRETQGRLEIYDRLLKKWNPAINLVSRATLQETWSRHFMDSAQIMDLAPKGKNWVDLGSGGGFPGMVCAIIGAERAPDTSFTLVEADQRKAAFLRTVSRETGVSVTVIPERIERVDPLQADILTARALTSLSGLLEFAARHLSPDGTGIFPKGSRWRQEKEEALETWCFDTVEHQSKTDADAVILTIKDISRGR